jgi:hypothetical protein
MILFTTPFITLKITGKLLIERVVDHNLINRITSMSSFWKHCTASLLLSATVLASISPFALAQDEAPTAPDCTDQLAACLYKKDIYRIDRLAYGCQKQKKEVKSITYEICRSKGKIVTVSEAITDYGDGIGYWFENGKVVAIRYFHDSTLVTFKGNKVSAFYDSGSENSTKPTSLARKQFETAAASGYKSIFKVFGVR